METQAVEYVTEKDLRAWDMLGGTERVSGYEPVRREPKQRKEKPIAPEQAHLPTKKEYKTRVTALSMAQSTDKALIAVQVGLGYDLSANSTHTKRFKRIQGWHAFCRCIQLICPKFTVSGISSTLVIENAPSRETLAHMFECAKDNPHSDIQLKRMLGV